MWIRALILLVPVSLLLGQAPKGLTGTWTDSRGTGYSVSQTGQSVVLRLPSGVSFMGTFSGGTLSLKHAITAKDMPGIDAQVKAVLTGKELTISGSVNGDLDAFDGTYTDKKADYEKKNGVDTVKGTTDVSNPLKLWRNSEGSASGAKPSERL